MNKEFENKVEVTEEQVPQQKRDWRSGLIGSNAFKKSSKSAVALAKQPKVEAPKVNKPAMPAQPIQPEQPKPAPAVAPVESEQTKNETINPEKEVRMSDEKFYENIPDENNFNLIRENIGFILNNPNTNEAIKRKALANMIRKDDFLYGTLLEHSDYADIEKQIEKGATLEELFQVGKSKEEIKKEYEKTVNKMVDRLMEKGTNPQWMKEVAKKYRFYMEDQLNRDDNEE